MAMVTASPTLPQAPASCSDATPPSGTVNCQTGVSENSASGILGLTLTDLDDPVRNGYDNSTMQSIMNSHITNVMTHWKGKCKHWDVVNEALEENGDYRRGSSPFMSAIGEAYIPIAFKTAASVDPSAKLFYNDYNIDTAGSKASGAIRIVKLVQSYGARIDGEFLLHNVWEPLERITLTSRSRRYAGPSYRRPSPLLHGVRIQHEGLH